MLLSLNGFRDNLLKGSFLLFAGNMAGNLCNYFFQFFMSRHLSVSDFGAMNSLLSLMVITAVPALSILLVATKYVSHFKANGELEKIRLFRKKVFSKLMSFGIAILILLLFVNPLVSSFLRIKSYVPGTILFLVLFFSFLIPLNYGTLQGLQRFIPLGICGSLLGISRLIFGIILVVLGLRLNGAMMALLGSYLFIFIVSFYFIRDLPKNFSAPDDLGIGFRNVLTYSRSVVLSSLGIMALTNVDLILVKHYFPADQAGVYAAIAVLGRVVFYFPGAIVMAMFPIVSENYSLKKSTSHILKKAFGITALLAGSGLIILMAVPELMLSFLFGKTFSGGASFLRIFSLAMFFMALNNVLCSFLLAIERKRFILVLLMGCGIEILLMSFFHKSLLTILLILTAVTFLICASLIYYTLRVDFKESLIRTVNVPALAQINQVSP